LAGKVPRGTTKCLTKPSANVPRGTLERLFLKKDYE